jgi:anoctamin-10
MFRFFEYEVGGEDHPLTSVRRKFCLTNFVNTMLGLREGTVGPDDKKVLYRDEAFCVFRTDRCFCSEDGEENARLQSLEAQIQHRSDIKQEAERLRELKIQEMEKILRQLYIDHTGSDEPCTELQFRQLVLRTVSTQLQIVCGLTVHMRLTYDETQVLAAIQADENDLRVEAARSNYKLHVHNHPFASDEEVGYFSSHSSAPTFNMEFKKNNRHDYDRLAI